MISQDSPETRLEEALPADLPFGWLRLDEKRTVISSSPSFVERFGQDVNGLRFDQLMAKGDRYGHSSYLAKLNTYTGGYLDTFATLAVGDQYVLARIRMRQEKNRHWFAIVEPIEYHDPIRELLEAQENRRAVLHAAADGVAFLDVKFRIVESNTQFLRICDFRSKHGVSLTETSIYGRALGDVADESFQPILEALKKDSERERKFAGRIQSRRKALKVVLTPTFLSRRVLGGYVLTVEDLTTKEENLKLSELSESLAAANTGLERAVQARTSVLQLVLDHTGDGILSVGLDGVILPERSQAVTTWFGVPKPGTHVWDYLAAADARLSMAIKLAFEQMVEGILPFHVASERAPKQIRRDKHVYSLEYRNVTNGDRMDRIVVLIRDITSQLEAERVERAAKDFHRLVTGLLQDRDGYRQSVQEVTALIDELKSSSDSVASKRVLHTIKGSCSVVGFREVADFVHELESRLATETRLPTDTEVGQLESIWRDVLVEISDFLQATKS